VPTDNGYFAHSATERLFSEYGFFFSENRYETFSQITVKVQTVAVFPVRTVAKKNVRLLEFTVVVIKKRQRVHF